MHQIQHMKADVKDRWTIVTYALCAALVMDIHHHSYGTSRSSFIDHYTHL